MKSPKKLVLLTLLSGSDNMADAKAAMRIFFACSFLFLSIKCSSNVSS